jgi:hypothetical protein
MSVTGRCSWLVLLPASLLSTSLMIVSTGCQGMKPTPTGGSTPVKTLTSVAVSPASASVPVGGTQQFTATANYSDGSTANVTATAVWAASAQSVATVSASGLADAISTGADTLTATLSGMSGNAALTVMPPPKTLTSIAVGPATAGIFVGAMLQFSATATYSDGSTSNITATASWTSSAPTVATVSAGGLASGVAPGSATVTAASSGISGSGSLSVAPVKTVTSIAVLPATASVAVSAGQQFSATATYSDGTTGDVTATAAWTTASSSIAIVSASGFAAGVAVGSTPVTASLSGINGSATLAVTANVGAGANVPMWHVDAQRSGLNAGETALSTANVAPQNFGKLFSYLVDGYMYGQPLLVSNLTIKSAVHNVVYAATENDSVYAFDADTYGTGAPLWQVSLLQAGESPVTDGPIRPVEGITSTPAIDLTTNTMYVVSVQSSGAGSTFRLNALDITTGAQKYGGPVTIQASVPGTNSDSVNGVVTLTTSCLQRSALLVANGSVFMGFGSCHSGWLLAYDEQTLTQSGVFNASPNLDGEGQYASAGGVWMGGGGPVADSMGHVYITTGNGPFSPTQGSFGESVLKFNSQLTLLDFFTPFDFQFMDCNDADLAAGGLLLIPGTTEVLGGGKTGKLYLLNTSDLGHEQANDAGATQTLWFEDDLIPPYSASCTDSLGTHTTDINSYEIFGTAAYFNGSVYLGITPTSSTAPAGVREFPYAGTLTQGSYTTPNIFEGSYGTTPFISANGTTDGILWMIDHGHPLQSSGGTQTIATLRAYDANNLTTELYNTGQNASDAPGYGIKFTSPIVANGKVYLGTGHDPASAANPQGELDVYGLK